MQETASFETVDKSLNENSGLILLPRFLSTNNVLINPSDEAICYNKPNNTTEVVPPVSIKVEKNNG